jgi:hypothetical protein
MKTGKLSIGVLFLVPTLALGLSACGDDNGTNNAEGDATLESDAGPDAEFDGGGDAGPDAQSDADVEGDTGPPDDDSDGVSNADDNCPQQANEDQLDRDRDGVGDACDHFVSIYDPSNPDTFEATAEDAENIPNDSFREGEAYELDLPFLAEGEVGVLENGQGDRDFYSFEISEPTLVLVEVGATADKFLPAAAVLGYEGRNANVSRFVLGSQAGTTHHREMFLPVPGRYSIIVTDQRNLTSDPDVGGEGYSYTASVSTVPMPEPEEIDLPSAPVEKDVDGRVHVYEVDATELDALAVSSTGVPSNASIVFPMLSLYDPDENRTLSLTSPQQTNQTSAKVEYTTKLGQRERVWVIEDFWQRVGNNKTLIEFGSAQVDSEFETFSEQQDERSSELVWMQPSTSVEGTIGPARTVSDTELAADIDYYLASVMPGSVVSFTVTPTDSSALQPEVDMGSLYEQPDSTTFLQTTNGPSAENPGEAVTVTAFYDGLTAGETSIRVRHSPNNGAEAPEGGPGFEYSVEMNVTEPGIDDLGELPAVVNGVFDTPGKTDFYRFTAAAGDKINFRLDENNYFGQMTVYDAETFQPIIQTYSARSLLTVEEAGDYVVHVAPYYEDRGPEMTYTLGVEKIAATDVGNPPVSETGVVDSVPFPNWYKMPVSAYGAYEATVETTSDEFSPRIRVYDVETLELLRSGSSSVRWTAPESGEVFVEIADGQDRGDPAYTYTLEVAGLNASTIALDTPTTGQLTDGNNQYIYTFTAPPGAIDAQVEATGGWEPTVTVARGSSLAAIGQADDFEGRTYYAESVEADYAIIVGATDDTLSGPLDFEITVTVHEPSSAIAEIEPNDSLADAHALTQLPAIVDGNLDEDASDTVDTYTLDLVAGQRIWLMSINRGDQSLYSADPEFEIYGPNGTEVENNGDSGEAYHPAIYAFEVGQDGTFEIRQQIEYGSGGDYTLYVFTSAAPTP